MRGNTSKKIFSRAGSLLILVIISCTPRSSVDLQGFWDFQAGCDTLWLNAQPSESFEKWHKIKLPTSLSPDQFRVGDCVTLHRRLGAWDESDIAALALDLGVVSDVATVYLNSTKIFESGKLNPYETGSGRRILASFKAGLLNGKQNDLFLVLARTSGSPLYATGPRLLIGPPIDVFKMWAIQLGCSLIPLVVFLLIGFYHLFLVLQRPSDRYNLFFGLFLCFLSIQFLSLNTIANFIGLPIRLRSVVFYSAMLLAYPFLVLFFSDLYYKKASIYGIAGIAVASVVSIALVFLRMRSDSGEAWLAGSFGIIARLLFYALVFVMLGAAITMVVRELLKQNPRANFFVEGTLILVFGLSHDILHEFGHSLLGFYISDITALLFTSGIAGLLAHHNARTQDEIEELNENLEKKVTSRTNQLHHSLQELDKIKTAQDGDYFLTSLLVEPLCGNFARSENVTIDYYVRQSKVFSFRKWTRDIGGDACIFYNIQLMGHDYVLIVNADSMGKSIQGAGGTLVFGSVLMSIVERTRSAGGSSRQTFPEIWLYETCNELQNVFKSFSGSMMVSAFIALMDTKSGLMYYVNAEHPAPILVRNGEPQFLDPEIMIFKFGSFGNRRLKIRTFQLSPGDLLFCGSDGKDDLLVNETEDGEKNVHISTIETRFLDIVKQANFELKQVPDTLEKYGKIIDDLSLIRISFHPGGEHAHNGNGGEQRKNIIRMFRQKDMAGLIPEALQYASEHPRDAELLHLISYAYRKLGKYREAAKWAERVFLRAKNGNGHLNIQEHMLENACFLFHETRSTERLWSAILEISSSYPTNKIGLKLKRFYEEFIPDDVVREFETSLRIQGKV